MNERIRQRMNQLRLKSVDLVNATKANKGTVSTWVNGLNEPKGEYLFSLAHALQVTPEWLLTGKGHPDDIHDNVEAAPRLKGLVPVINEVQAGAWQDIRDDFVDDDAMEWVPSTRSLSRYAFALRVVGDSMMCIGHAKSLIEGEIVLVDPEVHYRHRDIVVARLEDKNKATVKELLIDGDAMILNPLNDRYKPIEINSNTVIIGVVMDVVRRFR